MFKRIKKRESGQGMVEYGLILALVSIVSVVALGGLGDGIKGTFEKTIDAIGGNVPDQEEVGRQPVYTDEQIKDLVETQEYIKVATVEDLINVRDKMDGKYIQVADIDLTGITNFEPIGKKDSEFTGTFDGGGYVISNLKITRESEDYVGLFGRAEGATFKNIGLVDVNVTGGRFTGGLVGLQDRSSVTNSYATGPVKGGNNTGGLVGYQGGSSIENSYATGQVDGGSYTGGLVGYQKDSSTVTNSYATGSVTGTGNNTGGLVGYQISSSTVRNSYATGKVNGGNQTGGLVGGQDNSSITNNYATGSVNGGGRTGGLVGRQRDSSTVSNSYATGSVEGKDQTGGLVGYQYESSNVTNSYATGTVKGKDQTGGLVGLQENSSILNSYATGRVNGVSYTGGLVGWQSGSSASNSYYDKVTTEKISSQGGIGKTTAEMKNKETYSGWNTKIWEITDGQYPTLR